MRRFLHILLLLLPLFACTREVIPVVPEEEPVDDAPEGTVTVTFSFDIPAEEKATKAYGDDPLNESARLETLHLAVFGSSGYYKDYTAATRIYKDKDGNDYPQTEERTFYRDKLDSNGKPIEDDQGNIIQVPFVKNVEIYHFTAELNLSNTERVIHFIGNGPETIRVGKDAEVLPSELSGEGKTGFWQMIRIPAIKAKTAQDDNGNEYYINQNGGVYGENDNDSYVISDETLGYFRDIPLIRNWSKVNLKNASESNFTPISFAVVHVPKQGTLVPYGGKTGFIPDYQSKSFTDLSDPQKAYAYKGNLPNKENLFDETIPAADDFVALNANDNVNVKRYDPRFDENSGDYALDPSKTDKYDENLSEDNEPAVYLYERPVPTDEMQPTFVIVYGTYYRKDDPIFMSQNIDGLDWPDTYDPTNEHAGERTNDNSLSFYEFYHGVKCYYKVDFMSGGEYYPILRNFKYQILINKITARGHNTPLDAAYSAGSADVSANVNAAHLTDISDGTRRMAIQPWMSHTFIHSDKEATNHDGLAVKFIDDINATGGGINYNSASVKYYVSSDNGVTWRSESSDDDVISEVSIGNPTQDLPKSDDNGWRKIMFKVNDVAGTITLRISCKTDPNDEDEQPLYRDIVITRMDKQEMRIQLERERVPRFAGESQFVVINIPDGLPKSMFPLEFIIEPEKATLTPSTASGTENLPVKSGKSIIPGREDKSAIQFRRTVTWDEYHSTPSDFVFKDESRWRSFTCHFKTNCVNNATFIYVADKDGYFLSARDGNVYAKEDFSNYSSFLTPTFTTSIPAVAAAPDGPANVNVTTGVMADGVELDNYFFMEVENLEPVSAIGAKDITRVEGNTYIFVPTAEAITFQFRTTAPGGNVSVKLTSKDNSYEEATLTPWHFRNVGIVDGLGDPNSGSFAAYKHVSHDDGKKFLVGFLIDTGSPTPKISVKDRQGVKSEDDFTANAISDAAQVNYRQKWFQTEAGIDPISLTLSAVGYVEETVTAQRYKGAIASWDITTANVKKLKGGSVLENNNVTLINSIKGNFSLNIDTVSGSVPEENDNGILLPRGGRYRLNAQIESNNSDVFFYYAHIYYLSSDGTAMKPYDANVEPHPDGSSYSAYLAKNNEYMWKIPWGETAGYIDMKAPANQDIIITRIILRGFHGILIDSTDTGGGDIGLGDNLNDGGSL